MKTIRYIITDELGIHARPAGMITKQMKGFESKGMIGTASKMVDTSRIMGIMGLGIKQGDNIILTIEGPDEEEAAAAMLELLKANL